MESQKVYAVSRGSYSDYRVEAVFTTQELAQAYIDSYGAYGDFNDVEEYDLNPQGRQIKSDLYAFNVSVYADFRIKYVLPSEYYEKRIGEIEYEDSYGDNPKILSMYVLARDEEHAIKIASDKAAKIKATVGWGNLIK